LAAGLQLLHLITPSKIAGAERSTASLCEHLVRAGHRVTLGVKTGSPFLSALAEMGLDGRPLPIGGKLNPFAAGRVARLARELGAAVIHTHLSSAAFHGSLAARRLGLPSVAHVRALNHPFWYRWAARVIAVSHAVKEHLVARGMPAERIDVVYNGVDPERYYLPLTREAAKRRLGLPPEAEVVGVVAHLTAKKGHAVFVEAFARAAAQHPSAVALFLGDGAERAALEARVERLGLRGRVLFSGFHPDVLPFYAAFDVVALPSIDGEGLPRALLEGGLLGRACVGTQLSGVPEIIRDGETGFVVPVGDAVALGDRLSALLGDAALRERLGAAGRDWVSATFTIDAMVRGVLASYQRAGVQ
jgi:glycosyltransferase involved in cell wall biosynthesis